MAGGFLLVEDDAAVAKSMARLLSTHAPAHVARSLSEARPYLDRLDELVGVILDLGLPDGSGLSFLEALRMRSDRLHVTVLTGSVEAALINAACRLNASYAVKPMSADNLSAFLTRCLGERLAPPVAAGSVEYFLLRFRLTRRQEEILRLSLLDLSAKDMASRLEISEHAVKTRVRRLLKRTGHRRLRDLRRAVLQGAPTADQWD